MLAGSVYALYIDLRLHMLSQTDSAKLTLTMENVSLFDFNLIDFIAADVIYMSQTVNVLTWCD